MGWVEGWNQFVSLMAQDSTFTPSSVIRVEGWNQISNPTQKIDVFAGSEGWRCLFIGCWIGKQAPPFHLIVVGVFLVLSTPPSFVHELGLLRDRMELGWWIF